jgi:indolepyruvate ferredoxin oxidoreductase beta subunit
MKYNILLTGVGGQGLMLLSAVLGEASVAADIPVITQEQHGLAQRSGSISAHIRIGGGYSPMIPYGMAEMIIAMEAMEALRYIEYLKKDGVIVMNSRLMHPVIETSNLVKNRKDKLPYVSLEQILEKLSKVTNFVKVIDANNIAVEAGNPRTENIVLLGAASTADGFPLNQKQLISAIKKIVPEKTIEANIKAFELGSNQ